MDTKDRWACTAIVLGWAGCVALAWWALYYYGTSILTGRDAWWILLVIVACLGLLVTWGVVSIMKAVRQSTEVRSATTRGKVSKVVLATLSLLLLVGGASTWIMTGVEYYTIKGNYDRVHAMLLDPSWTVNANRTARREGISGVMADYDLEPRMGDAGPGADARVNVTALVRDCEDLGVNCYHFLIWHRSTDWDDFQSFVIAAENSTTLKARGFTCWLYLVPPSEADPAPSMPYGLDFIAWMDHAANFSRLHPVVTAVCIDDFYAAKENQAKFTPEYLQAMRAAADTYDPTLAIVTCLYWPDVDPGNQLNAWGEAASIAPFIDGILYPYMDQSQHFMNHAYTGSMPAEIQAVHDLYPGVPAILDIYVTKNTACAEKPNATYVGSLLDEARTSCEGVALYCGPLKLSNGSFGSWTSGMDGPASIYMAIKSRFTAWTLTGW